MRKISEISTLLKARRQELKWSQKDFLMAIGMTQQQYQRLESGRDMRMSTLFRVLDAVGLECVILPKELAVSIAVHTQANTVAEEQAASSLEAKLKALED
ncbi:TPA: helix-turn-helix domain-containing protein [Serratia fonticola]